MALDGLVVGEKGITGINATGAIMDTGTSLITASDDDALLVNSVRSPSAVPLCNPNPIVNDAPVSYHSSRPWYGCRCDWMSIMLDMASLSLASRQPLCDSSHACFVHAQQIPGMRFVNETKVWTLESGCDDQKIDALPPLGFVMGNKIFQLTSRQYIVAVRTNSVNCPSSGMSGERAPLFSG